MTHGYETDVARFEDLLVKLDQLIAADRCNSDEADVIREAMDDSWRRLSRAELAAIYARHPVAPDK